MVGKAKESRLALREDVTSVAKRIYQFTDHLSSLKEVPPEDLPFLRGLIIEAHDLLDQIGRIDGGKHY